MSRNSFYLFGVGLLFILVLGCSETPSNTQATSYLLPSVAESTLAKTDSKIAPILLERAFSSKG